MMMIGPDGDLLLAVGDGTIYVHVTGNVCALRNRVFHALDAEQVLDRLKLGSRRTTYDAVCGAKVRMYPFTNGDRTLSALWPPRLATLAEGVSRCQVCWETTGRKRPSGYFPKPEA